MFDGEEFSTSHQTMPQLVPWESTPRCGGSSGHPTPQMSAGLSAAVRCCCFDVKLLFKDDTPFPRDMWFYSITNVQEDPSRASQQMCTLKSQNVKKRRLRKGDIKVLSVNHSMQVEPWMNEEDMYLVVVAAAGGRSAI